jgi:hypothetical protein
MKMRSRRRFLWVVSFVALLFALGVLFSIVLREPSPLRVGATPDEVWSYIDTNKPAPGVLHGLLPIARRTMWCADANRIQSETRFHWRTNRLIAIRKTLYRYDTNDAIQRVNSNLELRWP